MPKIKLDIAGMYFSFEANVAAGACVKDVMDDVAVKTRAPDYKGPRFHAVDFKNGLLVGTDPTKNYVLAWQFYVYDKNGVEHARTNGTKRSIISFAEKNPAKMGYVLEDGSTVVWRLVAIFYKPL